MIPGSVEVCEELAFHGVDYIMSLSVAEGQVLLVDVEKVRLKYSSITSAVFVPCRQVWAGGL